MEVCLGLLFTVDRVFSDRVCVDGVVVLSGLGMEVIAGALDVGVGKA